MKHAHAHTCICSHEDLRFCKVCKVVHCLGCNQEWVTRTQGYWYNTNPYNYPWSTTIGGNSYLGGLEKKYASGADEPLGINALSSSSCSHKD